MWLPVLRVLITAACPHFIPRGSFSGFVYSRTYHGGWVTVTVSIKIQRERADSFSQAIWIEVFPLVSSLVLVKVAILLFYKRIFATPGFQIAVWVYISILVV
jgi:hypothetical protein